MKIAFTFLMLILYSYPITAQEDVPEVLRLLEQPDDNIKNDRELNRSLDTLITGYFRKENMKELKIIPIPPATKENSRFELLPLYKTGDIVVRFLKRR